MRDTRTYKEIFARQQPLRICSHAITISVIILMIVKIFLAFFWQPDSKLYSHFTMIALCLLPYIFQLIIKMRLSDFIMIFYIIYLTMSGVIGGSLNVFENFYGYDKIVHTAFGYVSSVLGLLLICKLSDYEKLSPVFVGLMIFSVSMMTAAFWELLEFVGGEIFGMDWQGAPELTAEGTYIVSKMDTMMDMSVHFIGAIIFTINFILHRVTGKKLLIGNMVRDFNRKDEPLSAPELAAETPKHD